MWFPMEFWFCMWQSNYAGKCLFSFIILFVDDGRTKPEPRKGHLPEPHEYKCLVRAQLANKKISTVVRTSWEHISNLQLDFYEKCINYFKIFFSLWNWATKIKCCLWLCRINCTCTCTSHNQEWQIYGFLISIFVRITK